MANIDLRQLQTMIDDAKTLGAVRAAAGKLTTAMDKVIEAQAGLATLLRGTTAKKKTKAKSKAVKKAHPKKNSAPAKLCKVMGSKPMAISAIAKAVKLSEGSVKKYVHTYSCFQNVRGKGYIYKQSTTATKKSKKKTAKKKKR